jgi:hypothetical protein
VECAADASQILADVDVVIGACDQPAWLIRRWLAEACRDAGKPLIHPSGLRVGPFYLPGRTACPMCEWAELTVERPHIAEVVENMRRLPRGNSGGLAPWAAITAAVTVMEVFRHLSGLGKPTTYDSVWQMTADYGRWSDGPTALSAPRAARACQHEPLHAGGSSRTWH